MNYFELFGIEPVHFLRDKNEIDKKYQDIQRKSHPDFFMHADEEQQIEALQMSARANEAYKLFKNPAALLAYYLELKQVLSASEKYTLAPEFLMNMMEINETKMEDKEHAVEQIKILNDELEQSVEPLMKKKSDELTQAELLKLKDYYFKHKYIQRLLDE